MGMVEYLPAACSRPGAGSSTGGGGAVPLASALLLGVSIAALQGSGALGAAVPLRSDLEAARAADLVAIDATIARTLLVPAAMRLLGDLNWWAPGRMRRLWSSVIEATRSATVTE